MTPLTVGSLFAGVGGFDMALETVGMEVVWQVEKDKQARSVLRRHWPDVDLYEDVHDVGGVSIPNGEEGEVDASDTRSPNPITSRATSGRLDSRGVHLEPEQLIRPDVICGGFPCQDYSVAGKRGGLAGDRGGLWWQMHRIISELMPTWVIGENVPGLLSSNGGHDFLTILASLVQLGYGVTWATLDSQYFGVAQRRRRLFIVGHSGGVPRPEILALSEGLFGHPAPSREAGEGTTHPTAGSLTGSGRGVERAGESRGQDPIVAHPLGTKPRNDPNNSRDTIIAFSSKDHAADAGEISPTLRAMPHDRSHPNAGGQVAIAHTLRAEGFDAGEDGTGRGTPIVASPITASYAKHHGSAAGKESVPHNLILAATVPRRLTPRECERLQAWPDDHTRPGVTEDGKTVELADGPRYRMCGNGVTSSVVEYIGHRIMSAAKDNTQSAGGGKR